MAGASYRSRHAWRVLTMFVLLRRRTIYLGPLRVTVVMPDATAERISSSGIYRLGRHMASRARQLARGIRHPTFGWRAESSMPSLPGDPPLPQDIDRTDLGLRQKAARLQWRQVVELTPTLATPGTADFRAVRQLARLPDSLAGLRCLDAARRDGFWAFELESRGAAEVVALDWEPYIDFPALAASTDHVGDSRAYAFARE